MHDSYIPEAVNQLKKHFSTGVTKTLHWRIEQLRQLKRLLIENQAVFIKALQLDLNKSEQEAWTSELGFLLSEIKHTNKHLGRWVSPRKVSTPLFLQPGKSTIVPEPLGTVLIIGAWNYPLQLVLAPLIAAIAAGNCAIIKPSELAEQTAKAIAELLPQYLSKDAFRVINGGVDETTLLLKLPFEHIFYTGGEAVGKIVLRAAAEHLTPVTLELGGKCPCIVDSDTNLAVTAARIVWSKWMNTGQTCVAPDYIIVEQHFLSALIDALSQKLAAFYGTQTDTNPDYGRIINNRHFARLEQYLQDQTIIYGGQTNKDTCYIAPTIVLNPKAESEIMQAEIFGPILIILTVDHIQQAISLINQKPKPLALYLFSNNAKFEQQVLSQTSAGNVGINDGMMFMANPNLPFGGIGHSGMGAYHGKTGFDTFSHLKTVLKRSFWFDIPLRYPPFSALKLAVLKKLL